MINNNYFVFYDCETINFWDAEGVQNPSDVICEVAAIVIDPRRLEIIEGESFTSLMKPPDMSIASERAMEVTGISREMLANAPDQKTTWENFANFMKKFNKKGTKLAAPIMVGHNIISFDRPIYNDICYKYGYVNDGEPNLFHPTVMYDTYLMWHMICENLAEPAKYNMDYMKEYLGLPKSSYKEGHAHRALGDCKDGSEIFIRLMKWIRGNAARAKFKGAFSGKTS